MRGQETALTLPTPDEDLQPHPTSTKWRLRLFQGVSIAGPVALTAYMPALGAPVLLAATVTSIWVEIGSRK